MMSLIQQLFSLDARVALVTGGNSGLGRMMALGLRDAGASVVAAGRNPARNEAMAAELGAPHLVLSLDVQDEDAVKQGIADIIERFGRLDILVNNASVVRVGSLLEQPRDQWDEVLNANLTGSYLCARYAAQAMIAQGEGGKIINIGSITAGLGRPNIVGYATSKAGLRGFTFALAVELAAYNIQVNLIEPGHFETESTEDVPVWLQDRFVRKTPAGRSGRPEELVGALLFLASNASNYVTGAILRVDGGYAIQDRLRHRGRDQ
jgi:NAD(P)-dependent dehydrogenase (short-subunit alcohol dehydrogenase family)